jgi:hypothetical protein
MLEAERQLLYKIEAFGVRLSIYHLIETFFTLKSKKKGIPFQNQTQKLPNCILRTKQNRILS